MNYYLAHTTIRDGGMEYGSKAVCEAETEDDAKELLLEEELDCIGEEREEDVEITLREISKEHYDVLKLYI
jgi:hypothetical protein